ncbi:nucleotide excision repair endonuclease [Luteolibacter sp. Populi]|uniref:nucleotide excision repair endonuclease n=1 Tax=Luteolibacter sp. Populi TaxID=3230487 RepID=UPI00346734BF
MSEEPPRAIRRRQAALFRLGSVMCERFGEGYFAALPAGPGVYFFSDDTGRLLYIGQSSSLRARIGSYRYVTQGKHPRRTLRLVARIHRIEWELCESAAGAIGRESELLLERRPPFNRAGVWKGDPWWLSAWAGPEILQLRLSREKGGIGPLPPAFRHVFGSLARCVYRASLPELPEHRYPCGLMNAAVPLSLTLRLPAPQQALQHFIEGACGGIDALLALLDALPESGSPLMQEFWLEERERLENYAGKGKLCFEEGVGERLCGVEGASGFVLA